MHAPLNRFSQFNRFLLLMLNYRILILAAGFTNRYKLCFRYRYDLHEITYIKLEFNISEMKGEVDIIISLCKSNNSMRVLITHSN